jgi:predicted MFS family arabinose efflux permease
VLAAYGIPRTALLVVGGHLSDRLRPWTVMLGTDAARAVGVAALALVASLGPARADVLVPIAIVLGAGEGLFLPGSFAIVPTLLTGDDLQPGNALISGGTQLATFIGPAIGGALVAVAGPAPAFAVDAATFAASALSLAGVRLISRRADETSPVADPAEQEATDQDGPTIRSLLRHARILQIGLLVSVVANLGSAGLDQVALPSLAHGPLHSGAVGYGIIIAGFGGGALLGVIVAAQASPPRRAYLIGSLVFLAESVTILVAPFLGSTAAVAADMVVLGALNGFGNVIMLTAFQRWCPPQLLGRLSGLLTLAGFGVFPISVALAAVIVRHLGPGAFFLFAGAVLAATILVALSQRVWREFGLTEPATDHSESPRSGHAPTATTAGELS